MARFEKRTSIACSALTLYRWHMNPDAFEILTPPWERVTVVSRPEILTNGAEVKIKAWVGPVPLTWIAFHEQFEDGRRFDDVQISGPFKKWQHSHLFEPISEGTCCMHDLIHFQLYGGSFLSKLANPFVMKRLERMFDYRHQQLISMFGASNR